jgi:hypothetical protein
MVGEPPEMVRSLMLAAAVVMAGACSTKGEPPPDPHGACAKSRAAYDKVKAAYASLSKRAPDVDISLDEYCRKLQAAATAGALATVGNRVLRPITARLVEVTAKCPHEPREVTQQAIEEQVDQGQLVIDKMCSRK